MGGARLTVHVTIEPGDGLSGSVVADQSDQPIAFSGWLGLVEAINLWRRRTGQAMASPPVGARGTGTDNSENPFGPLAVPRLRVQGGASSPGFFHSLAT